MSWDPYIANLKQQGTLAGCIADKESGAVWAKSPELQFSNDEIQKILHHGDTEFLANGCRFGGEKYLCIKDDGDAAIFKKGTGGFTYMKTNKAVVIGTYGDDPCDSSKSVTGNQANAAVGKIADHLKNSGY